MDVRFLNEAEPEGLLNRAGEVAVHWNLIEPTFVHRLSVLARRQCRSKRNRNSREQDRRQADGKAHSVDFGQRNENVNAGNEERELDEEKAEKRPARRGVTFCASPGATLDASGNDEPNGAKVHETNDGADNDKDGYIDLKDPGCADSQDNDETNTVIMSPSTVVKPAISSFIANPTSVTKGQSSTLSWDVSGTTSIILGPTKETLTASGKKLITPSLTTTYTITATNAAGSVSVSVTVTVK